jgi:transcription initiation factor TFIIIB Brf1 subunit/transcription initiation factor TFIIB
MEWRPAVAPAILNACDCGSDDVEKKPDGLVKLYRCADCGTVLGDITMGHEP